MVGAVWLQTLDACDVALLDGVVVKVLKAGPAKYVIAATQTMACSPLFWFEADAAVKGGLFKDALFASGVKIEERLLENGVELQREWQIKEAFSGLLQVVEIDE